MESTASARAGGGRSAGCFLLTSEGELGRQAEDLGDMGQRLQATESSGNPRLDRSLGFVAASIAKLFDVRPSLQFYDDSGALNAFASTQRTMPNSSGSVFFGVNLLQRQIGKSELAIVAICAHEFGHIVQYQSDLMDRLTSGQRTVKRCELHADFLAGYYLARNGHTYNYEDLRALAVAWQDIGDMNFTQPNHHGTPEERLSAIEAGFALGHDRPEFTIAGAAEVGHRYVADK